MNKVFNLVPRGKQKSGQSHLTLGIMTLVLICLSCNLPSSISDQNYVAVTDSGPFTADAVKIEEISTALKQTQLAKEITQQAAKAQNTVEQQQTENTPLIPPVSIPPSSTLFKPPATEVPSTELAPTKTSIPPSLTPMPPVATSTSAPPPTAVAANIDSQMQSAKILLYEDIAGFYDLNRWVREALNSMGLDYVDTKDAVGNFKSQLLNGTKWDLVIASSESRSGVRGEFFEYLGAALEQKTAVILEFWFLDEVANGKIAPILAKCGVAYEKDWTKDDPNDRPLYWLQPENPIFHEPNEGISLAIPAPYWFGDIGDLMRKSGGGDATLLAGTHFEDKSGHGVMASCYEGRFVIMTFSSHDYKHSEMSRLWQNMIYNTLRNHFLTTTP